MGSKLEEAEQIFIQPLQEISICAILKRSQVF